MRIALTLITGLGLMLGTAAQADEAALSKAGCMACHAKDKKLVGPSFKDVANKYKGQDVTAALAAKVRAGGKGVYGPIPMPANGPEKISDAELNSGMAWILKQGG
ncbi:c-type cytochrome [Paucibacter sp. APW11]|uniref:C-type cytochrome n=1 Tax=Roseateles aquae TaxID=3077235 RepID=A0ABU3P656_9BURK|nr:c-type cytochrome [Paucibacter sp. APW11]MDT8998038.1 c-type cytochrome [Paucibacter sp. APW11]